ncbi:hypothetical protein CUMW_068990 [Citrus unshiu]|nr:hypothetical protein CUMW_068990 [Citrus unshiu]
MQVRLHGRSPHILNKNSKFSGFRGEIARGLPGFSPPLCLCLPFFCSLSIFRAAQSTSLAIVSSIAVKTQNLALRSSWQHRLTIDFESESRAEAFSHGDMTRDFYFM